MPGDDMTPEAVAAICRHMNDDHRASALLLVQHLAGYVDAVDAETVGVDLAGLHLRVRRGDGTTRDATVAFATPVAERAQVRGAVVELHGRARAAAGLPPLP